jgi:hypothetical protein
MTQLRLIGSLTSHILCGVALVAQTSALNARKPSETPQTVHLLFVEDQEDGHRVKDALTDNEYHQHVKAHEATLRAMLAAGQITSGGDFRDAAVIFQHGDTADDCLIAHILAMEAMARGTAAATLDRYLQFSKQAQVFGTQYISDAKVPIAVHTGASPFPLGRTLEPYNENFLSDSVRTDFCVPVLAHQKQNVAMFNRGEWPRATMHPPCD